jgi:UDP-3-O-acyl-N-acetylglucosamine deacetylase
MKIVSCVIENDRFWAQFAMADPKHVMVTFEDGTTEEAFQYYSDELSFTEEEFVGLTMAEARTLHYKRDVAYLRSP